MYYIVSTTGVYSENFSGESVIVNLSVGNYYNVRNLANAIWVSLQKGCDIESLVSFVATLYKTEHSLINEEIESFISALATEKLINEQGAQKLSLPFDSDLFPEEYSRPELEVFNDLQDLFLLDPVHDVDSNMGWPFKPEAKH